MKIITFIIPSYNVELYLEKALNSFLAPELSEQLEVIIVDDGSSDKTPLIAQRYVTTYPQIYRLIQKENGGHGSVINVGSKAACGKYFKVIDADDWILTENLAEFIRYLEKNDVDVVLTPFHMINMSSGEKILQKMNLKEYDRIYTPKDLTDNWRAFKYCATFHGITYRTAFYNQHYHILPEKVFYEDQEYSTIPFCYAESIATLNLNLYQYLVGNSEQSVSNANRVRRIRHLDIVIDHMLHFWEKNHTKTGFTEIFFLKKMEDIVLSYYVNMCILNPQKKQGRKKCHNLNRRLNTSCSKLYARTHKKYLLYEIFSILHINENVYVKIIHSKLFRLIWHNHMVEKL